MIWPNRFRYWLFVLCCLGAGRLAAQVFQNVWVENFDNRNGLTQNTVWSITQDNRGLLWIGTDDGLLRYDGYQFKVYRSTVGKNGGLAGNGIRYLYSDNTPYLWVSTSGGLCRLNLLTDSVKTVLPNVRVRHILRRDNHSLWLATNKGLWYYDTQKGRAFIKVPNQNVLKVVDLGDNKLLFTTYEKCRVLDTKRNRYYAILTQLSSEDGLWNVIRRGNSLWIGIDNFGLYQADSKTLRVTRKYDLKKQLPALGNFPIRSIYETRSGKIWLSTHVGLLCFDPVTEKAELLPSDVEYRRLNSLKGSPLNQIFEDASGLLWVGSNNSGVNKINLRLDKFHTINQDNGLNYNFILSFAESGNKLLIGTDGKGLNVWNRETNQFSVAEVQEKQQNRIFSMTEVQPGLFWCATFQGLLQFDSRLQQFTAPALQHRFLFDSLQRLPIRKIYADSRQRIWVSSEQGMFSYDLNTHQFIHWSKEIEQGDMVSVFQEDKNGNVWIGKRGGLQQYSYQTNRFRSVRLLIPKTTAAFEDISDINGIGDSLLWLSSYQFGIGRYNLKTNQFKLYTTTDGLPNSIVYGSLTDERGNLWISTNMGLARLDPKREIFTNFDIYDGLQNNEFNGGSYLKLRSGEMVFGGVNGFNIFRPGGIQRKGNQSKVAITDVKIMNQSVNFAAQSALEISHKQNFVSFDFAALDFTAPQKNQYAYQLEGVDKNWIYSGNRHFVSYSQIPPGEYTFKVKAGNSDGVWNEQPAAIRLVVTAPFWANDWFRYITIGLGVAGLIVFFTSRIRTIQEREKEKVNLNRQIAALEMKALRAQMNPHFIFNCLNSINNFILHDQNRQASKYLTKFSKLIRQILDNTDTPLAPIERIVVFMNLYVELEQMRFSNNRFDFDIVIDPDIDAHETVFPTMMIQPHVENAIWHGLMNKPEKGRISMTFRREGPQNVACIVEDDGIGRVKSREMQDSLSPSRKSKGTQNVLESIETFNRQYNTAGAKIIIDDLYDAQNRAVGTRVKIILPDLAQTKNEITKN
ncbi:MAG: two-component regulator propeller domain-containing protein [Spirosomataceae bacterium]